MELVKKIFTFICLPFAEKMSFLQAIYYHLFFRVKLSRASGEILFGTIINSSSHLAAIRSGRSVPVSRIIRIIQITSRLTPCSTCLSEALTGYVIFQKRGYAPELHIGVMKDGDVKLDAHAWLVLNGRVVLGNRTDLVQYKEFSLKSIGELL